MRTIVYVDGFNLYHRLLKHDRSLRWLNIEALIRRMLFDNDELVAIKYYTAPVSKAIDENAPRKQETYLNALRSTPIVSTYFGSFLASEKWAGLIHPPRFKPELSEELQPPHPSVVRIRKFEEKGSDVNLGVHLVEDAYLNNFDLAIIVSNDTDFIEPIRIARQNAGKQVGLYSPVGTPAKKLVTQCSFVRHITPADVRASQFPDRVSFGRKGKVAVKPESWVSEKTKDLGSGLIEATR